MFRTIGAAAALFGLAASASATPVTVANYSFETLPSGGLSNHCGGICAFSVAAIPGWTSSGGALGQLIMGGFSGNPSAIDGSVMAYINSGTISQDVAIATAGTTYNLQIEILHRIDSGYALRGVAQIEIGGVVVATATGSDLGGGTWNDFAASYTATAGNAGQTVTILLSTTGGSQGDFDNVRLSANASTTNVAEPAGIAALAAGLIGIGAIRRRRFAYRFRSA